MLIEAAEAAPAGRRQLGEHVATTVAISEEAPAGLRQLGEHVATTVATSTAADGESLATARAAAGPLLRGPLVNASFSMTGTFSR